MKLILALMLSSYVTVYPPLFSQSLSLSEAQEFADQLHQDHILSKKGKAEYLRWLDGKPLHIVSQWEKEIRKSETAFMPVFVSEAHSTDSQFDISDLLGFFTKVEHLHLHIEQSNKPSPRLSISQSASLFKACNKLKGAAWKRNRPYQIDYFTGQDTIDIAQEQLTWWIESLNYYTLLSDSCYSDAKRWIDHERFKAASQEGLSPLMALFEFLGSRSFYYEKKSSYQADQLAYIDTLHKIGIISADSYSRLLISYDSTSLKTHLDIVAYFERSLVVDLQQQFPASERAVDQYRRLLELIRDHLLPTLIIDSLSTFSRDDLDETYGETYEQEILSLSLNGQLYQQIPGSLFPDISFMMGDVMLSEVKNEDVQFLQQYLSDQGSSYRLYLIGDRNPLKRAQGARLGIVLLDSIQWTRMLSLPWFFMEFDPFSQHHKVPSIQQIRAEIQDWQAVGIGSDWSMSQIDSMLPSLRLDPSPLLTLEALGCVADVRNTDIVFQQADIPYLFRQKIKRFSQISRGAFLPEELNQGLEETPLPASFPLSLGFRLGDKRYQKDIHDQKAHFEFWIQGGLLDFVNASLIDQQINGRFYCIEGQDTSCERFLFLTQAQFGYVEKRYPDLLIEQD